MLRKKILYLAAALGTLLVIAVGWYAWKGMHRSREPETVLPVFTELGPGKRAPTSSALGFVVGRASRADVEAGLKPRGVTCKDTSMRAMMRAAREAKLADIEAKKARGESVDGVSGASLMRPSPREKNPQVRLSCEETDASAIADRQRPPSRGRLLFVFDSPDLPLRHASYRRSHTDHAAALTDLKDTLEVMKRTFGEPTSTYGALPEQAEGSPVRFERLDPFIVEWSFADVQVKVEAMSFGGRSVSVSEAVEVPWPVRADAPALPSAPAQHADLAGKGAGPAR